MLLEGTPDPTSSSSKFGSPVHVEPYVPENRHVFPSNFHANGLLFLLVVRGWLSPDVQI